jgi:hypothetical protein
MIESHFFAIFHDLPRQQYQLKFNKTPFAMLVRALKKRLQFNLAEKCAGGLEPKVESAYGIV